MSNYHDLREIYKTKIKKPRLMFPLVYFKDVMRSVFQMFWPPNLLSDFKSGPTALYHRLFHGSGRQIYNVLVLVADLETNVGAACIELLNNEMPDFLKHFNYYGSIPNFDDSPFIYDYIEDLFDGHNDQLYNSPAIENISNNIQDESVILDAYLDNEDQIIKQINPDYLMQISLQSSASASLESDVQTNLEFNNDSSDSINILDIQDDDLKPFDTTCLTEFSTSETSCEWGDKENNCSDYESNDDESEFESECSSMLHSKPIKREINRMRMLGVPYEYQEITQSSHEDFKIMRSNPNLTKSQISSMVSVRRRYINRKAATRCRTQKIQLKDQLRIELKKTEDKLMRTRVSLTKAYQERNELKDSLRDLQERFVSRLRLTDGTPLSPDRWSTDLVDSGRSVVVREKKKKLQ